MASWPVRTFFGLCQLENECVHMHLAYNPRGYGSQKQYSLCPTMPALRRVYHKGSWSVSGLCSLNLHCLIRARKVPFQCHHLGVTDLESLWLEASHILILITYDNNTSLCFPRLTSKVNSLDLLRASSLHLPLGCLLKSLLKHKKPLLVCTAMEINITPTHQWSNDGYSELKNMQKTYQKNFYIWKKN